MNESRRVFLNRYWVVSLILLTFLSAWLYVDGQSTDGSLQGAKERAESYMDRWEESERLSVDEAIVSLENDVEILNDYILIANWYSTKESNPQYFESLREHYEERNPDLVDRVETGALALTDQTAELQREVSARLIEQYEHIQAYPDELDQIQERAERLLQFSIFNQEDSYSQRNIIKTADDFAEIDVERISSGPDLAITSLFDSNIGDYAVFGSILLLIYSLLQERRRGLWTLVYATPGGRFALARRRILILFLASLQAVAFIQGIQVLISLYLFRNWGDLSRPIQSIELFKQVTLPLSVIQFVLLYFLLKIVSTFTIAVLLYFLVAAVSNLNLGIALAAIVLTFQFILFTAIRDNALLVPLRYVNLFAYVNTLPILTNYLNLNTFGYPISGRYLTIITVPIILILFVSLSLLYSTRKYPIGSPNPLLNWTDKIKALTDKHTAVRGAFRYEIYKSFIVQKGLLILLAFLLFELSYNGLPSIVLSPVESTAAVYRSEYESLVTEDLISELEIKEVRLQSELEDLIESDTGLGYSLSIERLSNQLSSLSILKADAEDLLAYAETSGNDTYLFDDTIYRAYTNPEDSNYRDKTALRLIFVTTVFSATLFSLEKENKMTKLNRAACFGRGRLWRHKTLLTLFIACFLSLISYGSELYRSVQSYGGLPFLHAPIQQLQQYRSFFLDISIGQYLLLLFGIRLISLIALVSLTMLVSAYMASNESALILNSILWLVPAFMTYTGISSARWSSFISPLSAVELLSANPIYYFVIVIFTVLALTFCYRHFTVLKKR